MVKPTPSRFNPDLLARESTVFSVTLPLRQFSRLREMLLIDEAVHEKNDQQNGHIDNAEMHATFRFSRRKKTVLVSGNLKANFRLQCQRCLEPMEHAVDEPFELVFAKSVEAAHAMSEGLDPVVLDEHGQIHVVDLFEDELILHLPTVARHTQMSECEASEHMISTPSNNVEGAKDAKQADEDNSDVAVGKPKPFDVLKNLDLH